MKVKRQLLIGELSQLTGASPRSLRYYEDKGLLASSRTAAGYRVYDDDAVTQVRRVRGLLDAGFDSSAIAVILACVESDDHSIALCPGIEATMRRTLARLDAEFERVARHRDAVTKLLE